MVFLYSKKESLQGRSSANYVSETLDRNKPESQMDYRRSYEIKQQKSAEMKTAALKQAD
jgi:hypothetical protein